MRYLGDNVWHDGAWSVIGSDDSGFDLWLFAWDGVDVNNCMKHIGHYDTFGDIEKFLSVDCKVVL